MKQRYQWMSISDEMKDVGDDELCIDKDMK